METAQAQYQERRRYPRYSCDLGIEVRVGDATSGYGGKLADICLGGCYITTFSPLPMGTAVMLVVKNKNLELSIAGTVITSHPGVGMGVHFSGFTHSNGEADLKSLLDELASADNKG